MCTRTHPCNRLQQPIPALIVLAFYEQTLALILLDIAPQLPLSKNHMIVKETIQEELEKYFNSQQPTGTEINFTSCEKGTSVTIRQVKVIETRDKKAEMLYDPKV